MSARAAAAVNSVEVRCAGVRPPAKRSATTRSKDPAAARSRTARASATWIRIRPAPVSARPATWLVQRQPPPDDTHKRGVAVHRELPGSRPGGRHVPRQGEAAAAKMKYPQRLAGGRREVDEVPEPPHVLELQVARVVEVDVGLREAVYQQRPRRAAVRIAD